MGDGLDVRLNMHQRIKFIILLHHVPCGGVGVVSYLHRGGQYRELSRLPPVQDQRREHDARGDGGFAVLLRHQNEPFRYQPAARFFVVGTKDAAHQIKHPLRARLSEGR